MSSSQHPIALRIEQRVGGATKLLATVMCLPLLDGIFPALVLAGALDGPLGIIEVGLLIFGGSATVAVILAEMDGTVREQATAVLAVGAVLIVGASLEAAIAPTIKSMLDLATFKRFAAIVILAVAAETASARVGDIMPRPAVIVVLGMLASLNPAGAQLVDSVNLEIVGRAAAAAGVAVAFALFLAVFGPWLRQIVDIDRFRFGSAVALGILPLGLFGLIPGDAPLALAVLGVTFLFAFDPDGALTTSSSGSEPAGNEPQADGGDGNDFEAVGPASPDTVSEEDRAPWL